MASLLVSRLATRSVAGQLLKHPATCKNVEVISACFSISASRNAVKNVMVIGSGLMGAGIAQVNFVDVYITKLIFIFLLVLLATMEIFFPGIAHKVT